MIVQDVENDGVLSGLNASRLLFCYAYSARQLLARAFPCFHWNMNLATDSQS